MTPVYQKILLITYLYYNIYLSFIKFYYNSVLLREQHPINKNLNTASLFVQLVVASV